MMSTAVRMFDPLHGHPLENIIHVSDGWMWALFPHSFLNMFHPSSSEILELKTTGAFCLP